MRVGINCRDEALLKKALAAAAEAAVVNAETIQAGAISKVLVAQRELRTAMAGDCVSTLQAAMDKARDATVAEDDASNGVGDVQGGGRGRTESGAGGPQGETVIPQAEVVLRRMVAAQDLARVASCDHEGTLQCAISDAREAGVSGHAITMAERAFVGMGVERMLVRMIHLETNDEEGLSQALAAAKEHGLEGSLVQSAKESLARMRASSAATSVRSRVWRQLSGAGDAAEAGVIGVQIKIQRVNMKMNQKINRRII